MGGVASASRESTAQKRPTSPARVRYFASRLKNIGLYGVLLAIAAFQLRSQPPFILPIVGSVSAAFLPLTIFRPRAALGVYGFLLLVLPLFGPGGVTVITSVFLIGSELRELYAQREVELKFGVSDTAAGIIVLVLFGSLLRSLFLSFDLGILKTVIDGGGMRGLYYYLEVNRLPWSVGLYFVTGVLVSVGWMHTAARTDSFGITNFIRGVSWGALGSTVWCFLQWLNIPPAAWLNRSPFWISTGRLSATLSDPNAFGVIAGLLVPLLVSWPGRGQLLSRVAGTSLFLAAPWSGSRTYWLALVVSLGFSVCNFREMGCGRWGRWKLWFGVCGFFVLIAAGAPVLNLRLREIGLAPGLQRVLETLHWKEAGEALYSRRLYARLAVEAWKEEPVFGIGLGRFEEEQDRIASRLGIDLQGWRDNTNNFYLQLLVDTGATGFLLVIFALFVLAATLPESAGRDALPFRLFDRCLGTFVIVLLTGPHLFFEEVRFLVFSLIGFSLIHGERRRGWLQAAAALGLGASGVVAALSFAAVEANGETSTGLYPVERAEGRKIHWTAQEAEFSVCDIARDGITLNLRALHPDLDPGHPVTVEVFDPDAHRGPVVAKAEIKDREWYGMELPRDESVVREGGRGARRLRLRVSRVWSPRAAGIGADARWLGVQLNLDEGVCRADTE